MSARLHQLRRDADALLAARGGTADEADRLADEASARSLAGYLDHVVIERVPEPAPYRLVREPWQQDLMAPVVPAVEGVAGLRDNYAGPTSYARFLPRGHDKSTSIGRVANWLLAYSKRPLMLAAAAADSDQAEIIAESMRREAALNSWLARRVEYNRLRVRGVTSGSELKILAADAKTAYGARYDVILCDELVHWPRRDLWDALVSGRAKRTSASDVSNALLFVISNCGYRGTWQHKIVEQAKRDPSWDVYDRPGFLATWMSPEQIARDRALLLPGEARRLFDNEWVDPGEGGYLTRQEIDACEDPTLAYRVRGTPGNLYVSVVDYGPRRDRTALAVLHWDEARQAVVVDRLDVWQGRPGDPVPIARVENWLDEVNDLFFQTLLVVDEYQMEGTIQKYEMRQRVERYPFRAGVGNVRMAESLRTLIVSGRMKWYPDCGLVRHHDGTASTLADEIAALIVKITSYGYRFDHAAGANDDRACAIGMGGLFASQLGGSVDMTPTRVETPLQNREWPGIPVLAQSPARSLEAARGDRAALDREREREQEASERKPAPSIVRTWGGHDNPLRGLFGLR
jgi:hypothetical protein